MTREPSEQARPIATQGRRPAHPGTDTLDCLVDALSTDPESGINYIAITDGFDGLERSQARASWGSALASKKMQDAKNRLRDRVGQTALTQTQWSLMQDLAPHAQAYPNRVEDLGSMKSALAAVAAAAETFDRALVALKEERFGLEHVEGLSAAANRLAQIVDLRVDLALRAHKVRLRNSGQLSEPALHAASTALITTAIAAALELHPEARAVLCRIALVACLPYGLKSSPLTVHPLSSQETEDICEYAKSHIKDFVHITESVSWWSLAWEIAREHRSTQPTEFKTLIRLLTVASGYDLLISSQTPALSSGAAVKALARQVDQTFDGLIVTVLAAVVSVCNT